MDARETFFETGLVRHQNRLAPEFGNVPSLEAFKVGLGGTWSKLI